MSDQFEAALAEALERAQADERLPEWTVVRDLGWWQPDERVVEIATAYAPPLIADGREHDHLFTRVSLGVMGDPRPGWADRLVGGVVDRHLEEWRILVEHAVPVEDVPIGAVECSKLRPYVREASA